MKLTSFFQRTIYSLNLLQIAAVSVVLVVMLVVAYVFGYNAGRLRGVQVAQARSEQYMAKLPVEVFEPDAQAMRRVASNVYEKLSLSKAQNKEEAQEEVEPLVPKKNAMNQQGTVTVRSLGDVLRIRGSNGEEVEVPRAKEKTVQEATSEPSLTPTAGPTPTQSVEPEGVRLALQQVGHKEVAQGWYVQVSAPGESDEARAIGERLVASGFPVTIEEAKVSGRTYFRVLVGPESKRITAERLLQQLLREPSVDKAPFIRRFK